MTDSQIAAIAGEHFVAHKIAMLGFVPALVRQRVPGIDLLVSSGKGAKTVAVQIKSAFNATRESPGTEHGTTFHLRFPLGHRAITASSQMTFFCFVDLRRQSPTTTPDVYVVPASVLKKEYDGVYIRKYSQIHHHRPWHAMQPFRNNWDPLIKALTTEEPAEPTVLTARARQMDELARRWRDGIVLFETPGAAR